jgi:hypothetical protein
MPVRLYRRPNLCVKSDVRAQMSISDDCVGAAALSDSAAATGRSRYEVEHFFSFAANDLQQSWRFEWEPPKAVLRDHWTIDWILGG